MRLCRKYACKYRQALHVCFNPLKPKKRETVREDSRRVEVKRKHLGECERRFISGGGGRKSVLLEGTQAMPARPSDKDRMGAKTLGWWMVKA
jgi:hypothetical protein